MMIKQWIAGMVLCGSISMSAMDEAPLSECSAQLGICYLALIPTEIQSHIASFVFKERETKTEFIERTKKPTQISEDYFNLVAPKSKASVEQTYPLKGRRVDVVPNMGALNPNQTLFALLEKPIRSAPVFTIIDLQKKEDEEKRIRYKGQVCCTNYKTIALSQDASMIAYACWSFNREAEMGERCFEYSVQKTNPSDKTKRTFDVLEKTFIPSSIAFNKQGTCIILHREVINQQERGDVDHILFSLKMREPEVTAKKKLLPLQKYLRNRYICASLQGST